MLHTTGGQDGTGGRKQQPCKGKEHKTKRERGKETEERKGANEARKPAKTYKSIICTYFCL